MSEDKLREFVSLTIVEAKIKDLGEVDLADGRRSAYGSPDHINDIQETIASVTRARNRHKKGSAARENYSRAISRLKVELSKAQKHAESILREEEGEQVP